MRPEKNTNLNFGEVRRRSLMATALAAIALAAVPEKTNAEFAQQQRGFLTPALSKIAEPQVDKKKESSEFLSPFMLEPNPENEKKKEKPDRSKESILAEKILSSENVAYWDNGGANSETVFQALSDNKQGEITCGSKAGATVAVNKSILKFVLRSAESGNIMVNATVDKCHSGDESNHYSGQAIDLDCNTEVDFATLESEAEKFGGNNNGETCSTSNHYHFDFIK